MKKYRRLQIKITSKFILVVTATIALLTSTLPSFSIDFHPPIAVDDQAVSAINKTVNINVIENDIDSAEVPIDPASVKILDRRYVAHFDGVDDRITWGNLGIDAGLDHATRLSKFIRFRTTNSEGVLFDFENGASDGGFALIGGNLTFKCNFYGLPTVKIEDIITTGEASDNQWHSVGFTYDNSEIKIYFDGQQRRTTSVQQDAEVLHNYISTLGRRVISNSIHFAGNLYDFVIYNAAISTIDALNFHNGTIRRANLKFWGQLDETDYSNGLSDASSRDHSGTSLGALPIVDALIPLLPANGIIANNGDGSIDYTPNIGFTGIDHFHYTVANINGSISNVAEVSIETNRSAIQKIYWTEIRQDKLYCSNLDGSNAQPILSANTSAIAVDYIDNKIYWADFVGGQFEIRRSNLDGSDIEEILTLATRIVRGLVLDVEARKIYWSNQTHSFEERIERANLDGSNREILIDGSELWWGIFIDQINNKMYCLRGRSILRANLDGSNVESVFSWPKTAILSGFDLDIPAGKMYWIDSRLRRIQRANLDGSSIETLINFRPGISNSNLKLDLINRKMLWTIGHRAKIQRANLDGSAMEDLVVMDESLFIQDLALHSPPPLGTVEFITSESGVLEELTDRHIIEVQLSLADDDELAEPIFIDVIDTEGGTAIPGIDYQVFPPSIVSFPAGSKNGDIIEVELPIISDGFAEIEESIFLGLKNSIRAALGEHIQHKISILDSHSKGTVKFDIPDSFSIDESHGTFQAPIILHLPEDIMLGAPVTIQITNLETGTAIHGIDYILDSSVDFEFPVGSINGATHELLIPIIDDFIVEENKTINLKFEILSGPATIEGQSEKSLTITDSDEISLDLKAPDDISIICDASTDISDTFVLGHASAESLCGISLPITFIDEITIACPLEIKRTWTAEDGCGYVKTAIQMISAQDISPPGLTIPADTTISCDESLNPILNPKLGFAQATDNCTPAIAEPIFMDDIVGGCETVVTRTWEVTDSCGNRSSGVQMITLVDGFPPIAMEDHDTTPQDTPITINVIENDSDPDGDAINPASVEILQSPYVAHLDGSDDRITWGNLGIDAQLDHATQLSKFIRFRTFDSEGVLFDFENGASDGGFALIGGNLIFKCNFYDIPAVKIDDIITPGEASDNLWHSVGFTYDGSEIQTYFDGQPRGTPASELDGAEVRHDYIATLGRRIISDSIYFSGKLYDFVIFNQALSAEDVLGYQNGSIPQNSLFLWGLRNESDFSDGLSDASGNDHIGTSMGATPIIDFLALNLPTHGVVANNGDGTVTYTPDPGFKGLDYFNYTVEDVDGVKSNAAVVSVTVSTCTPEKRYWVGDGNIIKRSNLNGTDVEDLVINSPVRHSYSLIVDRPGNKMYWANVIDDFAYQILRANLDGSEVEIILYLGGGDFTFRPINLVLDRSNSKLYWTATTIARDPDGSRIERANLDGSEKEVVLYLGSGDDSVPDDLSLDTSEGKLYWNDEGNNIRRVNLDGTGYEDVITLGLPGTPGFYADMGSIYWSQKGKTKRFGSDGTKIVELLPTFPEGLLGCDHFSYNYKEPLVKFSSAVTAIANESALDYKIQVRLYMPSNETLPEDVLIDAIDTGAGTATADQDYQLSDDMTLLFEAGSGNGTVRSFTVSILPDMISEVDETIDFNLTNLQGPAMLGDQLTHEVNINDDDLELLEGKLYWIEPDAKKIRRANLDGTNIEDLVVFERETPLDLILDLEHNRMFWADNEHKIHSATLNGGDIKPIRTTSPGAVSSLILDPVDYILMWGEIYDGSEGVLCAFNAYDLNIGRYLGGNESGFHTNNSTAGRAVMYRDAAHQETSYKKTPFYFISGRGIWESTFFEGLGLSNLSSEKTTLQGIAVDPENEKLYWADTQERKIFRSAPDFSMLESLVVSGLVEPSGLALDLKAKKMYWSDSGTQKIQRANLDGSNVEDVIATGLIRPFDIEIISAVPPIDATIEFTTATSQTMNEAELGHTIVVSLHLDATNALSDDVSIDIIDTQNGTATASLDYQTFPPTTISFPAGSISGATQMVDLGILNDPIDEDNETVKLRIENIQGPAFIGAESFHTVTVIDDDTAGDQLLKIYWTEREENTIYRSNPDGSNVEAVITSGIGDPTGIAVDSIHEKIYWLDFGNKKIQRANLDGSGIEDLITTVQYPIRLSLDVNAGKMYWTDWITDSVERANLDGSDYEVLVSEGIPRPWGIDIDQLNDKMYWSDSKTGKIQRANFDGSDVEDVLSTGLVALRDLALDVAGGKMYWTDSDSHQIQRANVDGTDVEDLITSGISFPATIRLDPANGKMLWTIAKQPRFYRRTWMVQMSKTLLLWMIH